jgi:predicted ester cyclase
VSHLLIREYYACFNERRFRDAADLFARDGVLEHAPLHATGNGGEDYIQFAERWTRAFPDGQVRIEHVEQRGDTICEVALVGTGTHQGDFDMGAYGVFKATGAKATLRCREILEIRGGKITYASLTFDVHELIRQLTPPRA